MSEQREVKDGEHVVPNEAGLWFTDGKGGLTRLDFDPGTTFRAGENWWLTLSDRDRAICLALLDYASRAVQRRPSP